MTHFAYIINYNEAIFGSNGTARSKSPGMLTTSTKSTRSTYSLATSTNRIANRHMKVPGFQSEGCRAGGSIRNAEGVVTIGP